MVLLEGVRNRPADACQSLGEPDGHGLYRVVVGAANNAYCLLWRIIVQTGDEHLEPALSLIQAKPAIRIAVPLDPSPSVAIRRRHLSQHRLGNPPEIGHSPAGFPLQPLRPVIVEPEAVVPRFDMSQGFLPLPFGYQVRTAVEDHALLEAECVDRTQRPCGERDLGQTQLGLHTIGDIAIRGGVARSQSRRHLSDCGLVGLRPRCRDCLERLRHRAREVTSEFAAKDVPKCRGAHLGQAAVFSDIKAQSRMDQADKLATGLLCADLSVARVTREPGRQDRIAAGGILEDALQQRRPFCAAICGRCHVRVCDGVRGEQCVDIALGIPAQQNVPGELLQVRLPNISSLLNFHEHGATRVPPATRQIHHQGVRCFSAHDGFNDGAQLEHGSAELHEGRRAPGEHDRRWRSSSAARPRSSSTNGTNSERGSYQTATDLVRTCSPRRRAMSSCNGCITSSLVLSRRQQEPVRSGGQQGRP